MSLHSSPGSLRSNATQPTRRQFGQAVASSAIGTLAAPAILRGRNLNEKLNIAMIGVGGRGAANLKGVASENIVALCDVYEPAIDQAAGTYPQARRYRDFRRLYDAPSEFDAVVVSTTEHTHAFATLPAFNLAKHVYCEKPLTHNIWEARVIREAAAKAKVATQMGTQIHAGDNYRRVVELIQAGAIGPVARLTCGSAGPGAGSPTRQLSDTMTSCRYANAPETGRRCPPGWTGICGSACTRTAVSQRLFPGPKWYRWWDFGNGTMSDLGSHWNDLPFWASQAPGAADRSRRRPAAAFGDRPASMRVHL